MGWSKGPGDPLGTDLSTTDISLLADDLLKTGKPDVITLQEVAKDALYGTPTVQGLQQTLEAKTGDKWKVYFGDSGLSDKNGRPSIPYYKSDRSNDGNKNEQPVSHSFAGNAILVREGSGIKSSKSLTKDNMLGDEGKRLHSSGKANNTGDGMTAGSVVGVQLETRNGRHMNVFTTHIANNEAPGNIKQIKAEQIDFVRTLASQGNLPTVVTGDFNTNVRPFTPRVTSSADAAAMRGFLAANFRDATSDVSGTSSKILGLWTEDYDHIFTRNLAGKGTAYDSRMSDHRALTMTVQLNDIGTG